jgi:DNA-binding response OmpR family regulator
MLVERRASIPLLPMSSGNGGHLEPHCGDRARHARFVTPAADTVLLVEDAPDLGPLLRETVEEWNLRALLARTGAEALEVLAREPVALILLDHELPDVTGPELLEKLRFQPQAIPPVVLMGARLCGDSEAVGREVVEVLRKPFELSELAALLARRLPRR